MSFILKDGSEVADRRLGCIYDEDERRLGFPVLSMIGEVKPQRSYSWRCGTILDQGRDGMCVGCGTAHELIARPAECKSVDIGFARQIYHAAQKLDPWPGGAYPGAVPFYEGSTVAAGAKAVQDLGYIDNYYWATTLEDLILGIGYAGPAVIGVDWYEGMFATDKDGYIHRTGSKQGGHCVALTGVNIRRHDFCGPNSWGRAWGVNGFFRISWDDVGELLDRRGVACFFKGRHRI